jgi:exodeoxyribonuclease VII large subunit
MGRGQRDLSAFLGREGPDPPGDAPAAATEAGPRVMTVTEVTRAIKDHIESHPGLRDARVMGELSNVSRSAKGHTYFTLKDAEAQIPCVMWADAAARSAVAPEEGAQVVARGRVSVYERQGRYQLIVEEIVRKGVGDLYQRYLELKAKLEREGLFAPERKRPLPLLPRRVGVVTSATGSVFHDIVRVIRRRYPHVRVTLSHSAVQGEGAAAELVAALDRLARLGDVDVIIVARGGGSFEDLWPFNEEAFARAVAACPVPVVSGVGHETDYTICDLVADRRAATPSNAAEIVVPKGIDMERRLADSRARLLGAVERALSRARDRLTGLLERAVLRRPRDALDARRQRLDDLERRLASEARHQLDRRADAVKAARERLEALSPASTLRRGYSVALGAGGRLVSSASQVTAGDALEVVLADGRVDTTVRKVSKDARLEG